MSRIAAFIAEVYYSFPLLPLCARDLPFHHIMSLAGDFFNTLLRFSDATIVVSKPFIAAELSESRID